MIFGTGEMKRRGNNLEIANTIANQMGGMGRISVMIGLKIGVAVENGLRLEWKAKAKDNINTLTVTLNGKDLYDLEFGRKRGMKYTVKKELSDIYNDQLVGIFEDVTGLFLTLAPRR